MKKWFNSLGIYYGRGATAYELQIGGFLVHVLRSRFILTSGLTKAWIVPTRDDDDSPWRRLWGYEGTIPYFRDPGPRIGRIAKFFGYRRIEKPMVSKGGRRDKPLL